MHCPLCNQTNISLYACAFESDYFKCAHCSYIFKDRAKLLESSIEKSRYDTHNNDSEDQGYVDFLNRLILPLKDRLADHSSGLDFGCGPGPTISKEMKKYGHKMEDYDIYYANNEELLEKQYDFVTSTEVWEHFYEPSKDIRKCWELVKPGGYLGVMTYFIPVEKEQFINWWYLRDETHVGFYNEEVFGYIAKELGAASLEILSRQVVIFKKGNI